MANDITTLAVQIQSQEAERNLRTFHELMISSSQTAAKMEKMSIEVDVNKAVEQLARLRDIYRECASSAESMAGVMPEMNIPGAGASIDGSALEELKAFFSQSLESSRLLREEMNSFNAELEKLEAANTKVSTSYSGAERGARAASRANSEYAAAFRQVIAAQKEMERAAAKADEDMAKVVAADADAAAVKQRLAAAQRELKAVTAELEATHTSYSGDIMGLAEKEERLKNKVSELKGVYHEASETAEKFNRKLEDSAAKADAAREKYNTLKQSLDKMPKPADEVGSKTEAFSNAAKKAGFQATKMARGFNVMASMAGSAIPGVAGLGRALSLFGAVNPYVAAATLAIGGAVAVYRGYEKAQKNALEISQLVADNSRKSAEAFEKEAEERQNNFKRLYELNEIESLNTGQKEEQRKIVLALTSAYRNLAFQYENAGDKLAFLAEQEKIATQQDRQSRFDKRKHALYRARTAAANILTSAEDEDNIQFTGEVDVNALANSAFAKGEGMQRAIEQYRMAEKMMRNPGTSQAGVNLANSAAGSAARAYYDEIFAYVGAGKDASENIERVYKVFEEIDRLEAGTQWSINAESIKSGLEKYLAELEKVQVAEKEFKDAKEALDGTAERIKAGQELHKLKLLGKQISAGHLFHRDGTIGKKSDAQLLNEDYERLKAIEQQQARLARMGEFEKTDNGEFAGIRLQKLENERRRLLVSVYQQEERIAQQKERQLKSAQREAEALKAKLEATQKIYVLDNSGNILRQKNNSELYAERAARIQALQNSSSTYDYWARNASSPEEKQEWENKRSAAHLEMQQLQAAQLNADAQNREARRQLEEMRRGNVYDRQGRIVRRKSDAELAAIRQQEITAARAKVAAAQAGSTERYQAEMELEKLQQADFAEREKMSASLLNKQQAQVHTNVVSGIEARSNQALQLMSRNFSKPENKIGWKELEQREKEILDQLTELVPMIKDFTANSNEMAGVFTRL